MAFAFSDIDTCDVGGDENLREWELKADSVIDTMVAAQVVFNPAIASSPETLQTKCAVVLQHVSSLPPAWLAYMEAKTTA